MALDPDRWKLEEGAPTESIGDAYADVTASVAFGTAYTPAETPAELILTVLVHATGGNEARIEVDVDGAHVATASVNTAPGGLAGNPDVIQEESVTVTVPDGGSVTARNVLDPAATNSIQLANELQL